MKKIKDAFDTGGLSNPPSPFDHDEFVEKAEWMHTIKDW
jgi:hypothetical protein